MDKQIVTGGPLVARVVVARRALRRRGDAAVALGLLLLPLVVFAPLALVRATFYYHDVQHYFYPYHRLAADLIAQGHPPLWNPYAFSGIPLIGDGQTALFYPPNWLFFFLPGVAALNYDVLLQFCIAGLGMYLAMRSLELQGLPAFVAAVAYMFGGFMTARVIHLSILSGAALLPWVFFGVERALRATRLRWVAVAAVVVAVQTVAGHPQVPIYTALALSLYTVLRAVERTITTGRWRWLVRLPLRFAAIYTLGYGLAAIQLLPWIELVRLSPRAAEASFEFVFGSSMHGSEWLLFLFPYLYGSIEVGPYAAQSMDIATAVKTWEHSAYVGILPLALALVGLLGLARLPLSDTQTRSHGEPEPMPVAAGVYRRWFTLCYFALVLLMGVLLAAGWHTPLAELIYATPVIGKLRDVERAIVLAAFALTALAGFGMQRLIEPAHARRPGLLVIAVALVLIPVAVVVFAQQTTYPSLLGIEAWELAQLEWHRPNAYVPLAFALAGAGLLGWWSWHPTGPRTQALAAALIVLDMGTYAAAFNPTTDPQVYQRPPEVVGFLRQDAAWFRKATFLTNNALDNDAAKETLAVSWGMVYGIQDINGFNSLQPRRYTDYLFGPDVADVSYGYLTDERLLQPESPILSALNVKYLLVPSDVQPQIGSTFRQVYKNPLVRVYENTQVYPRAYFVDAVRSEPDPAAVLRAVTAPGFDGRRLALIEAAQFPPGITAVASGPAEVTITHYAPNQIVLTTSTTGQRFLVLSEMDFPGWRAYIDGTATPIYRTNYLFRGIVVPPGQHTISFLYRPVSVAVGMALTALAFLVVMGLLIIVRPGRQP
jgi:hypothetical protein